MTESNLDDGSEEIDKILAELENKPPTGEVKKSDKKDDNKIIKHNEDEYFMIEDDDEPNEENTW